MKNALWESVQQQAGAWKVRSSRDRQSQADAAKSIAADGTMSLHRDGAATHFTASMFVFDRAVEWVALCFHSKGQFWVQPGGHLEVSDTSVVAASLRELSEETGVCAELLEVLGVLDLDSHTLGDGFGRCTRHLDFGVAAVVSQSGLPELMLSDESEELGWWPLAELPENCAPGLQQRILAMRDRLQLLDNAGN